MTQNRRSYEQLNTMPGWLNC